METAKFKATLKLCLMLTEHHVVINITKVCGYCDL